MNDTMTSTNTLPIRHNDDSSDMALRWMPLSTASTTASTALRKRTRAGKSIMKECERSSSSSSSSSSCTTSSSVGSKGYEEAEDSDASCSSWYHWSLHDDVTLLGASYSLDGTHDDNDEIEQSYLQALFAERTAMEMKQLLDWWTSKMTLVPRCEVEEEEGFISGDDAITTITTPATITTLITSLEEGDDLDELQRQCLPSNSLVLVDDDDFDDDDDIVDWMLNQDGNDDSSNNNNNIEDRSALLNRSNTKQQQQQQSPRHHHSFLTRSSKRKWWWSQPVWQAPTNGTRPVIPYHHTEMTGDTTFMPSNSSNSCTLSVDDPEEPASSPQQQMYWFHNDHDHHRDYDDLDWQGVAQLQTLQVNLLCHETKHMADVLAELTDATATTSMDEDDSASDDEEDDEKQRGMSRYRQRVVVDDSHNNNDDANATTELSACSKKRHSQYSFTVDVNFDDESDQTIFVALLLQWKNVIQVWLDHIQCHLPMCMLDDVALIVHYWMLFLQVLSWWIEWRLIRHYESATIRTFRCTRRRRIQRLRQRLWGIAKLLVLVSLLAVVSNIAWGWTMDQAASGDVTRCCQVDRMSLSHALVSDNPFASENMYHENVVTMEDDMMRGNANEWSPETITSWALEWDGTRLLL